MKVEPTTHDHDAASTRSTYAEIQLTVYKCPDCETYHITKNTESW